MKMEGSCFIPSEGNENKKTRHILALSGGKDSSALAIYLLDKVPEIEYVFCDTGEELDETYEFIEKLSNFINKDIIWLKSDKDFKYYLDLYNGVLPDASTRWCTRMLKIKPFERFIGDDSVVSYVGIRADESNRKGYLSKKDNIVTVYPFIENNIRREDVIQILNDSGLGLPEYYKWRSRSGCYFCFFQKKIEWVGLLEKHPKLFEKAMQYEKTDPSLNSEYFTWCQDESLEELSNPERISKIRAENKKRMEWMKGAFVKEQRLNELWDQDILMSQEDSCIICHI